MSAEDVSLIEQTTPTMLPAISQKLCVMEKVGYRRGDLAANLVFQKVVTYLACFYTVYTKTESYKKKFFYRPGGF